MALKRETRYRNFISIGYPESLEKNWLEILEDTHIQFIISPLHDKDINPSGEIKKPHYHIMLMYEAPHTKDQAQEIFSKINAINCQIVNSTRGQARYLCHLDNPEKYQYNITDVKCLNGVDYQTLISLPTDNYTSIKEMIKFVKDNDVIAYSDLLEYAAIYNENWFRCLTDKSTYVIGEYIKSRTWKKEHTSKSELYNYDINTGELTEKL